MPLLFRPALWLLLVLMLPGCRSLPGPDTTPSTDGLALPAWPPREHADWLPLHPHPRVGDFAIHRQLQPEGLGQRQRRTEIIAVTPQRIELRRTFGGDKSEPLRVIDMIVDHQGQVLKASLNGAPGTTLPLQAGLRQQNHLHPAEALDLISGHFPIDHIVTRRSDDIDTTVYYLSRKIPFTEVVTLTTHENYSTAQMIRLLGRIATPTTSARTHGKPGNRPAIHSGWLLMHWGRR